MFYSPMIHVSIAPMKSTISNTDEDIWIWSTWNNKIELSFFLDGHYPIDSQNNDKSNRNCISMADQT